MKVYKFKSEEDFNKNFLDFQKNVLGKQPFALVVRADWCGHCRNMEKPWNEVLKKVQSLKNKKGVIVEVGDPALKHLQDYHPENTFGNMLGSIVKGYPFVGLIEANIHDSAPIEHNGARDFKSLKNFITSSFNIPR
jgi:thiol-disulfide isomerase/thioredoxin